MNAGRATKGFAALMLGYASWPVTGIFDMSDGWRAVICIAWAALWLSIDFYRRHRRSKAAMQSGSK
jgi:hypothetical protein